MSTPRKVVLIHPRPDGPSMAGLAEALRDRGAIVEQHFLTGDYTQVLDALAGDTLPVVVKPGK